MPTFEDALPALFGSLRPDKSKLLGDVELAAKEAEQKWPLLRNVSPKSREMPPALSDEERQNWNAVASTAKHTAPKPALSLPGVGEKIAKGLEKFSAKSSGVAAPKPTSQVESRSLDASTLAGVDRRPSTKKTDATAPLPFEPTRFPFSAPVTPGDAASIPDIASAPSSAKPENAQATHTHESLAQVFSRLEGKKRKPAQRPAAKSASFLGRLGKR